MPATRQAGAGIVSITDTIAVCEDGKSRLKIHCANNFFSASSGMGTQFLALPLALHTSPYPAEVTKFG